MSKKKFAVGAAALALAATVLSPLAFATNAGSKPGYEPVGQCGNQWTAETVMDLFLQNNDENFPNLMVDDNGNTVDYSNGGYIKEVRPEHGYGLNPSGPGMFEITHWTIGAKTTKTYDDPKAANKKLIGESAVATEKTTQFWRIPLATNYKIPAGTVITISLNNNQNPDLFSDYTFDSAMAKHPKFETMNDYMQIWGKPYSNYTWEPDLTSAKQIEGGKWEVTLNKDLEPGKGTVFGFTAKIAPNTNLGDWSLDNKGKVVVNEKFQALSSATFSYTSEPGQAPKALDGSDRCKPIPTPEPTPEVSDEPTPELPIKETPEAPAEPTPEATVEPTPEATVEPTPEASVEPTPEASVEPTPEATVEPTPEASVEPTPEATDEPTPEATVEPTPEASVEPTPEASVEPTPEETTEPTPEQPVVPTPEVTTEPTPELPVVPTPEVTAEPTPEQPVVPTPEVTTEPTPELPVVPTPVVPTPEVTTEPTPELPVVPTPVVPTPEVTAEPTPELPVVPTPEATAEPTPELPVVPTPEATAEPTPELPVVPTPEVTAEPTPELPVVPTPEATAEPTPVAPTPEATAEPTPVVTAEPTPVTPTPEVTPVIPAKPALGNTDPVKPAPQVNPANPVNPGSASLAETGADTPWLVGTSLTILLAGIALVATARRRKA
ncbi:hypothetical protein BK816_00575 [Boudabousia tangfeifanii]|uniref:Gram-positive cocci surface proteins LPxTG domain-containing protein n=1 Tax=Boudabousia tangfeifanii TaxID=1912795 RepID=A0A1D9MI24_9ACTO|nr:hypothetical protein [Boudabousia tangfeifanii]AOZ71971.1 hypothetical protein BK816_00575 [Boudabousia tangfeifanii]